MMKVVPKWANIAVVYTSTNLHMNAHVTQVCGACRDSAEEKCPPKLLENVKSLNSYACGQFNDDCSGHQKQICHILLALPS